CGPPGGRLGGVDPGDLVDRSADPPTVRTALVRADGAVVERLRATPRLAEAWVATVAASRSATRVLETDPAALAVLADLDAPVATSTRALDAADATDGGAGDGGDPVADHAAPLCRAGPVADAGGAPDAEALARWKRLEHLRITARDLLGLDDV